MPYNINKVMLEGTLGKDPEERSFANGGKVVSFSLATSESWTDKASGERKKKTQWHRIAIFNDRLCDIAMKYLKKGSHCYVEGAIETRDYTDKDGHQKQITEIVLARYRGELLLGGSPARSNDAPAPARSAPAAAPAKPADDWGAGDDEIPF